MLLAAELLYLGAPLAHVVEYEERLRLKRLSKLYPLNHRIHQRSQFRDLRL